MPFSLPSGSSSHWGIGTLVLTNDNMPPPFRSACRRVPTSRPVSRRTAHRSSLLLGSIQLGEPGPILYCHILEGMFTLYLNL